MMAVIGPTVFAILLWGTLVAVAMVFGYVSYAIGIERGWISPLNSVEESANGGDGR